MTTKTKKPTPGGCAVIPPLLEQVLAARVNKQ